MLLIGIDPGKDTGLGAWSTTEQRLLLVRSAKIHQAMKWLIEDSVILAEGHGGLHVIVEDARQRGGKREAAQGAGSVKRDCGIWEDYLTEHKIAYTMQRPGTTPTKRSAEWFQQVTSWEGVTNEHARDAAMIVYMRGVTTLTMTTARKPRRRLVAGVRIHKPLGREAIR